MQPGDVEAHELVYIIVCYLKFITTDTSECPTLSLPLILDDKVLQQSFFTVPVCYDYTILPVLTFTIKCILKRLLSMYTIKSVLILFYGPSDW